MTCDRSDDVTSGRAEWRVDWISPFPSEESDGFTAFTRRIAPFLTQTRLRTIKLNLFSERRSYLKQSVRAIAALLSSDAPVAHIHHTFMATGPTAVALAAITRLRRRRLIVSLHETLQRQMTVRFRLARPATHLTERLLVTLADDVLVHTDAHAAAVRRIAPTARVSVALPFGVDARGWPSDEQLDCCPTFVCPGAIAREKGADIALAAFRLVSRQWPQAQLIIAGAVRPAERAYVDAIEKEILASPGIRARIIRDPCLEHYREIVSSAVSYVMAFRSITQSTTFFEVLSTGKPVVVTPAGGPGEIAARYGVAIVAEGGTPEQVSVAMLQSLDRSARDELRRTLIVHMDQLSWNAVAGRLERIYAGS